MKKLILIGGGGHAKSCIDVIEQQQEYEIIGIIDIAEKIGQKLLGYDIIDCDANIEKYVNAETFFLITIGQIKSAQKRQELFVKLKNLGANFATPISPLAYVSRHAKIAEGSIVMHHAMLNANVSVGKNCIINSKALIEHDAVVEDHCHISTAAVVNGEVMIGEGSFLGSNAVTNNSISIAQDSFVKAGSLQK